MGREMTLVLIKPDGVRRGLVGDILGRFERKGLRLAAMKMLWMDEALARRHYAEHAGKYFFEPLVEFIRSGPLVAVALEGENAVALTRMLMGATDPLEAAPGTIRGDWASVTRYNLVHGSDSVERAQTELALFFREDEILAAPPPPLTEP